MSFTKCKLCDTEIESERCIFAVHRKVINGREYYFCCPHCADEFERNQAKQDKR